MTLTRRNGRLVTLGQNEAMKILLERSEYEMQQERVAVFEKPSFFARLLRSFIALAQTALQLQR